MKLIKGVILLSLIVGTLGAHPTYLGKRYPKRGRLSKSVMYTSLRNPLSKKQAPLVALVYKLNHKK